MSQSIDTCVRCGESTASGALYFDRQPALDHDGEPAWICAECHALTRRPADRRKADEPVGTQQAVIPTHIPYFG